MRKLAFLVIIVIALSSFYKQPTLKGTWEYRGGISHGKYDGPPKDYQLHRKYTDTQFDAFLVEKGEKPLKYESGNYVLQTDSCLETQTYCLQTQSMIGKTVHYWYTVRNDTLILKGKLPNGTVMEDYWKKVK